MKGADEGLSTPDTGHESSSGADTVDAKGFPSRFYLYATHGDN